MKERFTTSERFLVSKVLEEGILKKEERSLKQWMKMQRIKEDRDIEELKRNLVSYGTSISNSLSCLLFMMLQDGKDSLNLKFHNLVFTIFFMASLEDGDCGIGVAYSLVFPLFSKFEEMKKVLSNTSSWYETDKKIDEVLGRFQSVIATMDKLLSFPMLHEQMLSSVGSELRSLGPIVGELEYIVNSMKRNFCVDTSSLTAVDAFLELDREDIEQRWNEFIISDGKSEVSWLLELKNDERAAKRLKTGDTSLIDEEAALFKDAESRLKKFKVEFVGKMKEVLITARFMGSTRLAMEFGQFHVGAMALIKSCRESDPGAPVRQEYVSRMRKHRWPDSHFKAYDARLLWMRGNNAVSNKKNVLQLLQAREEDQPLPQSERERLELENKKNELEMLIEYAIFLGIRLSKHVYKLTGMLMLSGVAEMHVRINNLRELFSFLLELYNDSGPAYAGVVYRRIIAVMDHTTYLVRKAQVNHPHPYTEWAKEIEVKMDSLLDDLVASIATMDTLLSFPMMFPSSATVKMENLNRVYFDRVEALINSVWTKRMVKKVVDGKEEVEEEPVLLEPRVEGLVGGMLNKFNDQNEGAKGVMLEIRKAMKVFLKELWESLGSTAD